MISFFPVHSKLKDLIKEYWIWKDLDSENLPWILPSYEMELVMHFGDSVSIETESNNVIVLDSIHWVGPQLRRWRILKPHKLNLISIRFHPGAVYEIFGMKIEEMVNSFQELDVSLLDSFSKIRIELLEKCFNSSQEIINIADTFDLFFLKKLQNLNSIPSYLKFALSGLNYAPIKINELAKNLGISRKQLDRKFKQVYGISPKDYRRIHRNLESIRNPNYYKDKKYLQIIEDYNYTDQSHLIHDFKTQSGINPSAWFKSYDKMSHFYNTDSNK